MKIQWDDMELFLAIVRGGSLRSGARELGVDVSTVSRRLSQLEHAAGARLLQRDARRLQVTAAGAQVLSTAERMAGEVSGLSRKIAAADPKFSGIVRVTAASALSALVTQAVTTLARSHPHLEVELLSLDTPLPLDGTQVDVAVRIAEAPPEHLVGTRVARLRSALYASTTYLAKHKAPLTSPAHAWIEWDRRLAGKPAFQWLAQSFPERRVAARGLSTRDVHALARAGLGIAALPRVVGDSDPELRRMQEVPDAVASSIWLLTHDELRTQPRVRVTLAAIKRALLTQKAAL